MAALHPPRQFVDALLGARCLACGAPAPGVCGVCGADARGPVPGPVPLGLDHLVVGRAYRGVTREAVARVKYRNERAVLAWLAAPLVAQLAAAIDPDRPPVVTWAPTTASRRRSRGFDHARLLAAQIARPLGLGVTATLDRVDGTARTGMAGRARRVGPQVVARGAARGCVVVVDDVLTTGGTLRAAANALRAAGAEEVWGVVAARTEPRR